MALSPDERTLYVTNGGTNSVAVIRLQTAVDKGPCRGIGLIPTGWYPNAVSVSQDGSWLYVVNGKSNAGPNPGACRDTLSTAPEAPAACRGNNQYIWQPTEAGLLSLPLPFREALDGVHTPDTQMTEGLAEPMAEVFEPTLRPWTYTAAVPEVLRTTQLPVPARTAAVSRPLPPIPALATPRCGMLGAGDGGSELQR